MLELICGTVVVAGFSRSLIFRMGTKCRGTNLEMQEMKGFMSERTNQPVDSCLSSFEFFFI